MDAILFMLEAAAFTAATVCVFLFLPGCGAPKP
jgi:hypothetical protein